MEFCGFVGPQGLHGVSNGSLLGTLRDQISAELGALVAPWFQGGSQTPKRSHLDSLWRHFGVSFRRILRCVFYDCFKQNVMSLFKLLATSGRIFVKAHLVNARVVKHFVYNAPALNVPPGSLTQTGLSECLG